MRISARPLGAERVPGKASFLFYSQYHMVQAPGQAPCAGACGNVGENGIP